MAALEAGWSPRLRQKDPCWRASGAQQPPEGPRTSPPGGPIWITGARMGSLSRRAHTGGSLRRAPEGGSGGSGASEQSSGGWRPSHSKASIALELFMSNSAHLAALLLLLGLLALLLKPQLLLGAAAAAAKVPRAAAGGAAAQVRAGRCCWACCWAHSAARCCWTTACIAAGSAVGAGKGPERAGRVGGTWRGGDGGLDGAGRGR
jgi:hypothetical protein